MKYNISINFKNSRLSYKPRNFSFLIQLSSMTKIEQVEVEIATNKGRIDAIATVKNNLYLFEFKINQNAKKAIQQIIDKKYYEIYLKRNKTINLVGINFDIKQKNIANWEHKKL